VTPKDRFLDLFNSPTLNGIDFVEVDQNAPLDLRVHFINSNPVKGSPIPATIDGGDSVPTVGLAPIADADWSTDSDGHPVVTLHAQNAGDFSNYRLTLVSDKLDRYFSTSTFSFKVFCPSDFDCAPPTQLCPPDDATPPPIDYLAKDFASFRRALSDFSAQRYPDWRERGEADFGVMFLEALCALADDLSYQQDRVAAEATLDNATERRSVVRHARLVDYQPRPETVARAWLMCQVSGTAIPAGVEVRANDPAGGVVPFEIGSGLADTTQYVVDPRWNYPIQPYWWDDSQRCLRRGATATWLAGGGFGFAVGQALLIDTAAQSTADPPIREIVHLTAIEETTDLLYGPTTVTRIAWSPSEALAHDHDLTRTQIGGNLLPATQGRRTSEGFAIETAPASAPDMPLAFARLGANATAAVPTYDYRYCLSQGPLAWLADDNPDAPPAPEIRLQQPGMPPTTWSFMPRLLDAAPEEPVFSLEPASYRRSEAYGVPRVEYDGDSGDTILFGNGDFGALPQDRDRFELVYRIGAGARGNVAADSITQVDPQWIGLIASATNPFPGAGGADPETIEQIRRRAPQAFQARQFRAVLAKDYEVEAERLDWVQQASTAFRWTGSWFTVFTAIDPKGGTALSLDRHTEVIDLLNRRRLAGYESYVPPPRYVSVDLAIDICARPEAFSGDVERDVLAALAPVGANGGPSGFFFADHFTFGTPLERSRLEAAIQIVPGVAGVLSIRYRRRGFVPDFVELPEGPPIPIAVDEILRIDNDPNHPERGSLAVTVLGGK
jgi:hypothetical protein